MGDKFTDYYSTPEKIEEMSEYVHLNFRLIMTKMQSEMRRKLDIEPNTQNQDGYYSLACSLQGRLFNEMVYSLCGMCQALDIKFRDVIPKDTILLLFDLMEGKNPLQGKIRTDVHDDKEKFEKYYMSNIAELRAEKEALPK